MIGQSKMNERLPDIAPKGIFLDVNVSPIFFLKRYKEHLILIILDLSII